MGKKKNGTLMQWEVVKEWTRLEYAVLNES